MPRFVPRSADLSLALYTLALALALASPQAVLGTPLALDEQTAQSAQADTLAQFAPRHDGRDHRLDFTFWGEALSGIVVGFGPSLRKGAARPSGYTGTRIQRGHRSRLRMEGSRIAYSFFNDSVNAMLSEYRADLENIGSRLDIPSLPRNEQLAFWLNLHNVAVIEQIALAHPIIEPSEIEIGGVAMDEARFIEVAGVKLSPKDIRTRIVYPNWSDPRVVYGFHRGEIGGPTIQPEEFNARNLDPMLSENAKEFVNALRGTEKRGKTLHVSKLYEEAAPFYFANFESDLRAHLGQFAEEDVQKALHKTNAIKPSIYERDIADLARGQTQPYSSNVESQNRFGETILASSRIPPNIQRYVRERREKIRQLTKRGERLWSIKIIPIDLPGQTSEITEVE